MHTFISHDIEYLSGILPCTKFLWIDILPRLRWRGASGDAAKQLDLKRKRVNRFGRAAVHQTGRGGIIVPNIDRHTPGFYDADGTHLSTIGLEMYLYTLQSAISSFLSDPSLFRYVED